MCADAEILHVCYKSVEFAALEVKDVKTVGLAADCKIKLETPEE